MTLHPRHIFLCLGLVGLSFLAHGQEYLRGLNQMPANKEAIRFPQLQQKAALSLPFADDFSYSSTTVDPSKWEASDVWVNQTWGRSPITLGMASFDGLNRFGRPYAYVGNDSVGDVLSSLSIDLSNPTDSVYLSFFYQAGGWGELPAVGDDSLTLQFWDANDSVWRSVWRNNDFPETDWIQVMQAVDTSFHQGDFRFRFRNYGSKQGALDLWHLDYVRLNDRRTKNDTAVNDIAFTRPHPSFMVDYEAIPWWHVNQAFNVQSIFKPDLRLFYRRNVGPGGGPNIFLGEFDIFYNGASIQSGPPDPTIDQFHNDNEETRFPVPDTADAGRPRLNIINPPYPDEFEITALQTYSGVPTNQLSANDTLRHRQVFKNYYAYDDGSAERAYEIRNNRGGFIVQRYDILVNDTLKGLQIYFQPALYNVEDQDFTILILSNVSGRPGAILYESDSVYTAQYTDGNFYQTYLLDTTLAGPVTNGTVFIGIRQEKADPLSLGYDQNSRNRTSAFYGELNDMYQSFLGGTIMMRPVFGYIPRDISLIELDGAHQFQVYPNPSSGALHFKLPKSQRELEGYQLKLYNLQGALVAQKEISLDWNVQLPAGLYIIRLESQHGKEGWQSKIQIR